MKKLVLLAVVVFGFAATSFAQTLTANSIATILPAITIQKNADLDFGGLYSLSATLGADILLPAQAGAVRTSGDPTKVALQPGNSAGAAKFTITGVPGTTAHVAQLVNLDTPNNAILTNETTPGATMELSFYQLPGTVTSFTFDASGQFSFYVGGKLHVNGGQAVGRYSNNNSLAITVSHP